MTQFDDTLARLVSDLLETCRFPGRAGLAAPQIGVQLRVFSYNVDEVEGYVVNPEAVAVEGEMDGPEGCLSIPKLSMPCRRAQRAVVRGVDLDERPVEIEGEDLLARCLQHETDHLDGRLYLERLDGAVRRQALATIRNRDVMTGSARG